MTLPGCKAFQLDTHADHDEGTLGVLEVLLDQKILAHQCDSIRKILVKEAEQVVFVTDHLEVGKRHEQGHSERFVLLKTKKKGQDTNKYLLATAIHPSLENINLQGWAKRSS